MIKITFHHPTKERNIVRNIVGETEANGSSILMI